MSFGTEEYLLLWNFNTCWIFFWKTIEIDQNGLPPTIWVA